MTTQEKIEKGIKEAMLNRDAIKKSAFRSAKSAFTEAVKAPGHKGDLTETEAVNIIKKLIKQREDSAMQYRQAGREDLAVSEEKEMEVLSPFVPKQMTEDEVEQLVACVIKDMGATSKKEMGAVMKQAILAANGLADGKTISKIVSRRLS